MCVVSAVMDQYGPYIPTVPQWPQQPYKPQPYKPYNPQPNLVTPPTIVINNDRNLAEEVERLRELIDSFHKAVEAAEVFDRLTGQPDCVDPEKAQLEERVAKLERKLDEIGKGLTKD